VTDHDHGVYQQRLADALSAAKHAHPELCVACLHIGFLVGQSELYQMTLDDIASHDDSPDHDPITAEDRQELAKGLMLLAQRRDELIASHRR
jgi:hypothetical protein